MYIFHLKPDQPEAQPKRIDEGWWATKRAFSTINIHPVSFLAISSPEQLSNIGDDIVPPLWMINSLVLVILGIFTITRADLD